MNGATTFAYARERECARRAEETARGNKQAVQVGAEKLASLAGRELGPEDRQKWRQALHWGAPWTAT